MVENQIQHPSAMQLTAYGLGKLSPQESAEIESHIAQCDSCCQSLGSVENDTLVDLICSSDTVQETPAPRFNGPESGKANRYDQSTLPPESAMKPSVAGPPTAADDSSLEPVSSANEQGGASTDSSPDRFYVPTDLVEHPRYKVLELLGSGGMGSVYKAEHRLMERTVALKVISSRLTSNEAAVARFRREVKTAARLSHPNIVTAYDAEQAGNHHMLVMEFVEGTDLGGVLRSRGRLPVTEACDYIRQAALGLQHASEYGMVHRDIKPQNLMLTPLGHVKILDFGLAQLVGDAAGRALTSEGSMMGTPDYMAPEQARDARTADIRADVYSLGCTFYALLTGRPPFPEGSEISKVMAHTEREPEPVSHFRDDMPEELTAVLRKMMAKRPDDRYQTPADVAAALNSFLSDAAGAAPPSRSSRWKVGAVLAATVLLIAGVIFVVTDQGQLKIESFTDDVEVVISKAGREITTIDLKTDSKVRRLPSGEYQIDLKGETRLKLDTPGFTLSRGGQALVKVERAAPNEMKDTVEEAEAGGDQISSKKRAALDAALDWLKFIDEGKYAESHGAASEMFRTAVTDTKWTQAVIRVANQTGPILDRQFKNAHYTTSLPGISEGEFVVLQFDSFFEKSKGANEMATLVLEPNNEWKIASYEVRPRPGTTRRRPSKTTPRKEDAAAKQQQPEAADAESICTFGPADTPIQQNGVTPDEKGWKIVATEPQTVRLFEVDNLNISEARLVFRARIKAEKLAGRAYLEMWVRSPGLGESFSRALNNTVSGTSGWSTIETPFFLNKGQSADLVRLNLVIEGEGTVWIDQVELLKTPLPKPQLQP